MVLLVHEERTNSYELEEQALQAKTLVNRHGNSGG